MIDRIKKVVNILSVYLSNENHPSEISAIAKEIDEYYQKKCVQMVEIDENKLLEVIYDGNRHPDESWRLEWGDKKLAKAIASQEGVVKWSGNE